jgi:HNH endonuclease
VDSFIGNVVTLGVVGFVIVAVLSLLLVGRPATPSFARRPPASGSVQLRQDPNAQFFFDRGFLFRRRCWFVGTCCPPLRVDRRRHQQFAAAQGERPVSVAMSGPRVWWWFQDAFYWDSGGYGERDVLALIRDRQRKSERRLDRARMLLNAEEGLGDPPRSRREGIPLDVRRAVFERDGGQCVQCASTFELQYDHVLPVALGGATSFQNLQLLCGQCNREKGADL